MRQIEIRTRDDDSGSDETRQWLSAPAAASVVTIDTAGLPVVTPLASVAALGGAVMTTGGTMTGALTIIAPAAALSVQTLDAGVTTAISNASISHSSTAVVGVGFGSRLSFNADFSGTGSVIGIPTTQSRIQSEWLDPAGATRMAAMKFIVVEGGSNQTVMVLAKRQIQCPAGDINLPGITWQGQLNSGISWFSAGNWGLIATSVEKIRISTTGVGIGVSVPTAALHLKAGTATAGTAPLKLTTGVNLTVAETGTFEFVDNGTTGTLYFTVNVAGVATRKTVTLA